MNKRILFPAAAVLAVVILAGAAYLGGQLLVPKTNSSGPEGGIGGPGGPGLSMGGEGGPLTERRSVPIDMIHAEEIPEREPDAAGMITALKDNSFTMSVGGAVTVAVENGGKPQVEVDPNAPVTEVVVTKETMIYEETTFADRTPEEGLPGEGEQIQQTVAEISFSDLAPDTMAAVWGYKRGDRLIAEVIMMSKPVMFSRR